MTDSSSRLVRFLSPGRAGLAAAAVIFLVTCHVSWIDESWDASLGGITSGGYYGYACQAFEARGFFESRLVPVLFFHPGSPDLGFPYYNHPPAPHLLVYPSFVHGGRDERALRIPILALLLATLVGVAWVTWRAGGAGAAFTSLTLFATAPMVVQYGNMVDAPPFALALLVLGTAAWFRWRDNPSRGRYALYFLFALAGGLADWFGFFLVPAAWIDLWFHERKKHGFWRRAFWTGWPFGLALLAYLAWLFWAIGESGGFREQLEHLFSAPTGRGPARPALSIGDYAIGMSMHLKTGFGLPLLAFAIIGFLASAVQLLRGKACPLRRAGLVLAVAGLAPAVAFRERAVVHEFWILTGTPGIAVLGVVGMTVVFRACAPLRKDGLVGLASALIFVAVAGFNGTMGVALHDSYRTEQNRTRGTAIGEATRADDLIISAAGFGAKRFYCKTPIIPDIRTRSQFDFVTKNLVDHKDHFGRLIYYWPENIAHDYTWLAELPRLDFFTVKVSETPAAMIVLDKEAILKR